MTEAREALLKAQEALNTWTALYAPVEAGDDAYNEARERIAGIGILAYIADTNRVINAALASLSEPEWQEALEKCRDTFVSYAGSDREKAHAAAEMGNAARSRDAERKAARNDEMAALCERALSASPKPASPAPAEPCKTCGKTDEQNAFVRCEWCGTERPAGRASGGE